jgi:hypothetical protein
MLVNKFSTLELLFIIRFDTNAYTLDTISSLDPKRPGLTKWPRRGQYDVVYPRERHCKSRAEKNEPPLGGSEVNREASNRVARHHPGSI